MIRTQVFGRALAGFALAALVFLTALAMRPAAAAADHDVAGVAASVSSGSGLGLSAELDDGLGLLGPSPTALGGETSGGSQGPGAGLESTAADPTTGDFHSANFHKLDRAAIDMPGGELAQGTDLAFQGSLLIAGAYEGVGPVPDRRRRQPGAPDLLL